MQTIESTGTITDLAAAVAAAAAPHADRHDLDGTFVTEGVEAARENGYLAAAVPAELGGGDARTADIVEAQMLIARACGSTALACAMHQHTVLAAAWRWRKGDSAVEGMLKRVANEHIAVVSTGGSDWMRPTTVATPVEGGWKVNGRKTFGSISPAGQVAATFAVVGAPEPGAEVLVFGLPLNAPGVRIDETWDSVGMRGTGSHDLVLEDVFVAEGQVNARRTWGVLDRPLLVASLHAWPVISATYLGVADALVDTVLASGKIGPSAARQVGMLDALLRSAHWAIKGALADLGPDPEPTIDNFVMLQQMKRHVVVATQEISTIAAELAGGGAYARRGAVDRMIRDLRAAMFHPNPPEATLVHSGRYRLGILSDTD